MMNGKSKLTEIIGENKVRKLADGFQFTEGPVWVNGYLRARAYI
jgi:hypothetical protein